jgi:soluble P-type ATPase
MRKMLVCLMFAAKSIIACSLSAAKKAVLVRLMKENLSFSPVTLAVGQNIGDLAMMREADVSVGLMKDDLT